MRSAGTSSKGGRRPLSMAGRGAAPSEPLRSVLDAARREMEKAITGEDYEAAARLRDEIAGLEQQLAHS